MPPPLSQPAIKARRLAPPFAWLARCFALAGLTPQPAPAMCLYAVAILALACCRFPARFERVPPLPARWLCWLVCRLPDDSQPTTPSRRLPSASPPQPAGFPPLPPSPPTPRGRGGVKFAPTSLSQGGRCLIICPPQSVRSNEVVNVPPFIGHGRKPKFVFLVKSE